MMWSSIAPHTAPNGAKAEMAPAEISVLREGQLYLQRISTTLCRMDTLPFPSYIHVLQAFLGSFVGILVLSYIDHILIVEKSDLVMIVGSFGAQAVLIFATPHVPLAQPWNCIFGNTIGAIVGVSFYKLFDFIVDDIEEWLWIASALAVSVAIVLMLLTKSLHPPAGATALIAVQGSQRIHDMGYYYVLFPAIIASALHVVIGIVMNNFSKDSLRSYPVIILPFRPAGYFGIAGAIESSKQEEPSHVTHPQSSSCNNPDNAPQYRHYNDVELVPTLEESDV